VRRVTITLRPYQHELVADVRAAWASGAQNVLMHLATGGGKTLTLAYMILNHDGPVCVIAHRDLLVSQLSQALAAYGVHHDIIASDATRREVAAIHVLRFGRCFLKVGSTVRVASVDTLVRRRGLESWAATVTMWVTDESHHLVLDNKWHKATEMFTHPRCVGLGPTATPTRADGKGLGRHADGVFDVMVHGPSCRWLIEEGWLCDYDVLCPTSDMQVLSDVAASGDWSPKVLKEASQKSHIVGDVVEQYLANARGKLGATFATDVDTAKSMAAQYRAAGVPAEVLVGETLGRMRVDILRRLERREIYQICVVDVVSEGFDLPSLEVLSAGRPTQSLSLRDQQFGRGLRPMFAEGHRLDTRSQRIDAQEASPKGRRMLYIDHVGNFVRHQGGPDAPRVWTLDRREKRRGSASGAESLRVCTECFKPFKRVMTACPHCGAEIPPPAGRAGPEQVDGDLALLSPEVLAALRADLPESEAGYRERLMASGLPEVPLRANMRRHRERLEALAALRHEIAVWSGRLHADGMSDREIHKAWWLAWGGTVFDALSLNRADAIALTARVKEANDE
jgi:superfamily II DNA or RNA helicase